jgi:L-fucose mutarotase
MLPAGGATPEIQRAFRKLLPEQVPVNGLGRSEFYQEAKSGDTALVIATGEQRVYANILLVIGVVPPAQGKE